MAVTTWTRSSTSQRAWGRTRNCGGYSFKIYLTVRPDRSMDCGRAPGCLSKAGRLASRNEGLREDCETVSSRLFHDWPKGRRLYGNCWPEFMSMRLLPKRALTPAGG